MRCIIAGSRDIKDPAELGRALDASGFDHEITEVVSGGARGVDRLGEHWATAAGVPLKLFPARWDLNGRAAGPIRNGEMAAYADALVAVWDGKSGGTADMIYTAKRRGLRVYVHRVGVAVP